MTPTLFPLLVVILGLCVGSFLNAAVFRFYEGTDLVKGRSKCMRCQEPIRPLDLIPVLSFFLLRGRCRNCKQTISWQYPLLEFALGILFLIFYYKHGPIGFDTVFVLIRDWIFISFLALIFVYDFRYMIIPDQFSIPAIIVAVLLNLWIGTPNAPSLLLGAIFIGGFFYAQFVFSKGTWVGGGDMRLGVLIGVMLGLTHGLVALFLAYVVGAIVGVALLLSKRAERKTPLPFGTFMTAGTVFMLFFGSAAIEWYLSFFV